MKIGEFFGVGQPKPKVNNVIEDDIFVQALKRNRELCQIMSADYILCSPVSSSLANVPITKELLAAHILIPNRISGEFVTLDRRKVSISSNIITCSDGFPEVRKVKINTVNSPCDIGDTNITVYETTRPFIGGLVALDEVGDIHSDFLPKFLAMFRTFPDVEHAFVQLDNYLNEMKTLGSLSLESYSKISPSLSQVLKKQWQRVCKRILRCVSLLNQLGGGNFELAKKQVEQVVETYMMKQLGEFVYAWLFTKYNLCDQLLQSKLMQCTQADLGIRPEFQISHVEAISELSKLSEASTPIDKMIVFRRTISMIRDGIDRNAYQKFQEKELDLATDDIVLVVSWVIVQLMPLYRNVAIDLTFCEQFHFSSSSMSEIGYSICHFQVAIGWITELLQLLCFAEPVRPQITAEDGAEESDIGAQMRRVRSEEMTVQIEREIEKCNALNTSLTDDSEPEASTPKPSSAGHSSSIFGSVHMPSFDLIAQSMANFTWTQIFAQSKGRSSSSGLSSSTVVLGDCSLKVLSSDGSSIEKVSISSATTHRMVRVLQLACCCDYFSALTAEGEVYTWGKGEFGRLGRGIALELQCYLPFKQPMAVPRLVAVESMKVQQISCGRYHMLALTDGGEVYAWGDNRFGQLGVVPTSSGRSANGLQATELQELSSTGSTSPVKLTCLRSFIVCSVACGAYHSLCLTADGSVYSWGLASNGRLGQFSEKQCMAELFVGKPSIVSCQWQGAYPAVTAEVFQSDATLTHYWNQQLTADTFYGAPNHTSSSADGLDRASPRGRKVVCIAAGYDYSIAVTLAGTVFSWGCGMYGALGHGSHCDEFLPKQIQALSIPGMKVIAASAFHHSMFQTGSGYLLGCGLNHRGQVYAEAEGASKGPLKSSVLLPRPIEHCGRVQSVCCGESSTAALTISGELRCWGSISWKGESGDSGLSKVLSAAAYSINTSNVHAQVAVGSNNVLFC